MAALLGGCASPGAGSASPSRAQPITQCGSGSSYDAARGCVSEVQGERIRIEFTNDFGRTFMLRQAVFEFDGGLLFETDDPAILSHSEFVVYAGDVEPGAHKLQVDLVLSGNGYGQLAYLRDSRFQVRSERELATRPNAETRVRVIGQQRGGPFTPLERRPAVRFE
jgi:hypothetical protein